MAETTKTKPGRLSRPQKLKLKELKAAAYARALEELRAWIGGGKPLPHLATEP